MTVVWHDVTDSLLETGWVGILGSSDSQPLAVTPETKNRLNFT